MPHPVAKEEPRTDTLKAERTIEYLSLRILIINDQPHTSAPLSKSLLTKGRNQLSANAHTTKFGQHAYRIEVIFARLGLISDCRDAPDVLPQYRKSTFAQSIQLRPVVANDSPGWRSIYLGNKSSLPTILRTIGCSNSSQHGKIIITAVGPQCLLIANSHRHRTGNDSRIFGLGFAYYNIRYIHIAKLSIKTFRYYNKMQKRKVL